MNALLYGTRGLIVCVLKHSQNRSITTFASFGSSSNAYQIVDEAPVNTIIPTNYHTEAPLEQETDKGLEALKFGTLPSPTAFVSVLKAHAKSVNWEQVNKAYTDISQNGLECDAFICSSLISIYAKLGSLEDAWQVFSMACSHDVVLWNAMIVGFTEHGHGGTSLCLFMHMQQIGVMPSKATILGVLRACTDLEALDKGRKFHILILWSGLGANVHVASCLIEMYGRCGSIRTAKEIFDHLCDRDAVLWNIMVTIHIDQSLFEAAHALFEQMKQEGMLPNTQTVLGMLKGCAKGEAVKEGMFMHAQLIGSMFEQDLHVVNALMDMYAKCNRLKDARDSFDKLKEKSVVSWNVMLIGYVQQGLGIEALSLYQLMHEDCVEPDGITLTTVIKACTSLADLELGKLLHILIVQDTVFQSIVSVCNALIEMYAACKSIEDALSVFHSTCQNSAVMSKALIAAYCAEGLHDEAVTLFHRMQQGSLGFDVFVYTNVLKACAKTRRCEEGKAIYAKIVKSGLDRNHLIITSLVDMFMKCGSLEEGNYLFENASRQDVALWTSVISGYFEHSMWEEAALLLKQMEQKGVHPDGITHIITLKICAGLLNLEWGKDIHADVLRQGLHSEVSIANTIMDMYVKCRSIGKAYEVFQGMSACSIVSWNVMITGFDQEAQFKKALDLFRCVYQMGAAPEKVTFINALKACSMLGALEHGKQLHAQIKVSGYEMDVAICNTLMDMYIKCGSVGNVYKVFTDIPEKSIVSWNVVITGYAQHGLSKEVTRALKQMHATNLVPDAATFSSVLSSCNYEGLKSDGYIWFVWFVYYYGVLPIMEVYASLMDLLCRAGCLWEAQLLIREMHMHPNAIVWMTMLGACRVHGNAIFGKVVLAALGELGPSSDTECLRPSTNYAAFESGATLCC